MSTRHLRFLAVAVLSVRLAWASEGAPPDDSPPASAFKDPATGMELLFVKGGCYLMGDVFGDPLVGPKDPPDDQPVHDVCVHDFYIGKYEVTQGQWQAVMGTNPSSEVTCEEADCPVDNVSPSDALEFVRRMNVKLGAVKYRLPTEAEWEYAARSGGKSERYAGGNDVESVSWYRITTGYSAEPQVPPPWAHPVGQKAPNGLGLYDMSGNVYEWTSDRYSSTYYATSPKDSPTGPPEGSQYVKRGGCAHGDPRNSRTVRRWPADERSPLLGLRVLKVP